MNTNLNYIEINKESWNQKTKEHVKSDFYDVKGFLEGSTSLNQIEIDLLGNIEGKKILHLQCHFGMDSISLSQMGAKVIGVDLSDESIKKAKQLAKQVGTDTEFICCNIFDLPNHLNEEFDIIFTSYGVINWYPDLNQWGKLISHYLKPNGKFIMVEFHPMLWMFDTQFQKIEFPYSTEEPITSISETYTDASKKGMYKEITWNHGLSKIFQGLLENNLQIMSFHEYDYSPVNLFGNMTNENGQFRIANAEKLIPILFSVVAEKSSRKTS